MKSRDRSNDVTADVLDWVMKVISLHSVVTPKCMSTTTQYTCITWHAAASADDDDDDLWLSERLRAWTWSGCWV